MSNRHCPSAILFLALVVPIIGCSNSQVGSIQITPASQSLVAGQTAQFTATGIIGHGNHPATNEDVTNQVTWTSNCPCHRHHQFIRRGHRRFGGHVRPSPPACPEVSPPPRA